MKGKWFAFGCLTSVLILVILMISMVVSINKLSNFTPQNMARKLEDNSVLHLKLSGEMMEYNEFKDDVWGNPFSPDIVAAHDIIEKIRMATNDPKIKAIILEPKFIAGGYATLHDIGTALKNFRANGKKVYAYLEMCSTKDYFLASFADEIYLNPSASAGILLTGVGGTSLFYKDLFEKIGVEMTVLHAGEYKGAGENFYLREFSAPVKSNITNLYADIYDNLLQTIAQNRQLSADEIDFIFEEREQIFINQRSALDFALVDDLLFREDFINSISSDKNKLVSAKKYLVQHKSAAQKDKIAVLYLQGQISQQVNQFQPNVLSAKKLATAVDEILKDRTIKAVVLRIDSPGGSALESEIMHDKLSKLRQKIPVVVSMANVAASGGYYIATPSDYVMADKFSITGSIGVVAMFPNIAGLRQKIGISTDEIGKGKYSNILDFYSKPDPEMLKSFKLGIDQTYREFKIRVSEGRSMNLQQVEAVARGQVWSSQAAVQKGLIDQVGNLAEAKAKAADLAGIEQYYESFYPRPKSFFEDYLLEKLQLSASSKLNNDFLQKLKLQDLLKKMELISADPIQMILPAENLTD
ncbi:MAG: signal peptide peptidase SppA [Candidatus Cloacimonadales bacterium]